MTSSSTPSSSACGISQSTHFTYATMSPIHSPGLQPISWMSSRPHLHQHTSSHPQQTAMSASAYLNLASYGLNLAGPSKGSSEDSLDIQQDSVYSDLPNYRFPQVSGAPPLNPASSAEDFLRASPQPVHRHVQQAQRTDSGFSPMHISTSASEASLVPAMHNTALFSPLQSPLMPHQSYKSTSPSTTAMGQSSSSQGPPLPVVSVPNTEYQSKYSNCEASAVFASGMVVNQESYGAMATKDAELVGSVKAHPPSNYLGISYPHSACDPPQQRNHYANYDEPETSPFSLHFSSTSTTHPTTSTYIPSSAYLPSKSTFGGITPNMPSQPHSAPSTPIGRQDAYFLSSTRGNRWTPSQTPQPGHSSRADSIAAESSPLFIGSPALSAAVSVPLSTTSLTATISKAEDTNPRDAGNPLPGVESVYIPYARNTKMFTKRITSFPPGSPNSSADSKRAKKGKNRTKLPVYPAPQPSEAASQAPLQEKAVNKHTSQRCKIACSACRRTRLRCE